jgi:hypothetical protein
MVVFSMSSSSVDYCCVDLQDIESMEKDEDLLSLIRGFIIYLDQEFARLEYEYGYEYELTETDTRSSTSDYECELHATKYKQKFIDQKVPCVKERVSVSLDCADSQSVCSICFEDLRENQIKKTLSRCKHMFHNRCINKWLRTNMTCPICRDSYG